MRPYPVGSCHERRHDRGGGTCRRVPFDQRFQGVGRQERDIPGQEDQDSTCPSAGRIRSSGAHGRCLVGAPEPQPGGRDAPLARPSGHPADVPPPPSSSGSEARSRVEDIADHGLAGDAVEHLRNRGFHPRSLACSKDDDVKIGHQPNYRADLVRMGGGVDRPVAARSSSTRAPSGTPRLREAARGRDRGGPAPDSRDSARWRAPGARWLPHARRAGRARQPVCRGRGRCRGPRRGPGAGVKSPRRIVRR